MGPSPPWSSAMGTTLFRSPYERARATAAELGQGGTTSAS
eukprot:CAMPEP_0174945100 /NCGR_PEP_ID=MMETSP1355-20121228/80714_1 /TAXON_ID=464990 /ORGANISM="Hemiselmis tepida, Strain CCMP443" /LENGTH=39 /DNA_ID= /DNA_START= /DNA_END= /DNA_ORIENTATION=